MASEPYDTTIEEACEFDEFPVPKSPEDEAYDALSRYFYQFDKLPDEVRTEIWVLVAYWPRVVGLSEFEGSIPPKSKSKTRPPAMLSVCHESRFIGLTIYTKLDDPMHTGRSIYEKPIYINREVDVLYQGRSDCWGQNAFRMTQWDCSNHISSLKKDAICCARTLAVDPVALTLRHKSPRDWRNTSPEYHLMQDKKCDELCIQRVAACIRRGVRHIILVVGNERGGSEFTLVPITKDHTQLCFQGKEKQAMAAATWLRTKLEENRQLLWNEDEGDAHYLPPAVISVMTVQRPPLQHFSLFPKFPPEVQTLIWKEALKVPRIISFHAVQNQAYFHNPRIPAVGLVCRRSRATMEKELTSWTPLPPSFASSHFSSSRVFTSCNLGIDTIRLSWGQLSEEAITKYSKCRIQSLGIDYKLDRPPNWYGISGCQFLFAYFARLHVSLREIVILVGDLHASCDMTLVPLSGSDVERSLTPFQRDLIKDYARVLRKSIKRISADMKDTEREMDVLGQQGPSEWMTPTIRIACVKHPKDMISPYSY